MGVDKKLYTKDSIESLSPLEFTRLRPGVYAGDCTYSTQLLVEIVSNAVDEFRLGHGNRIEVKITGDIVSVQDYGQGFLVNEKRDDGKTILEAAFSVLNTSGKYREDGTYEGTSLGSFGIGSKITTFLSHYLCASTWRDGKGEEVWFKEGVFEKRILGDEKKYPNTSIKSGTLVEWQPSEEFFTHTEVEINKIKTLFKTIACLCPGLTIDLHENLSVASPNTMGCHEVFYSEHGLNDLVDDAVKDNEIIKNRFNMQFTEGKYKMNMVLTYTSNYSSTIVPYVNTGLTDSGPHITQLKTLITREFNKFFRDKKWLKDKDENLTGDDVQEGMYIVFNMTAPNIGYDAQVKSRVTKIETAIFTQALAENLRVWLETNEKEIKTIADKAINAKKAREAAKKAREAARGVKKDKKKQLLNLPSKLVDCWCKDRLKCELFIAEGDSAASGLVEGRDAEIHAVFPIRGKIISAYKNKPEKIFANAEVINIIKAIGLELDPKTQKLIYDIKKLRYGKILLAADADPDGASIRNLLIEMFWWLCPELVLNGHIYTTMPPLFRITTSKNKYIYLKDTAALEQYKASHQGEKYTINRNKGLGEQDSDELAEALLNPDTRNVFQLVVEDEKETANLIEVLLGPSVPPRREFLLAHEEEANENE